MLTRKPTLPPLAGLFGKLNRKPARTDEAANEDQTALDREHQADLNRRAVAFTAGSEENLAA